MSEIRAICRKAYQEYVKAQPYPTELKNALKAHERVPAFIDNLAREFSKPGLKVNRETVEMAVRDLTNVFVSAVKIQAEQRLMNPLKIAMVKAEQARKAEMNQLADALDKQGDMNEQVTQDQRGNQIIHQKIIID